MKIATLVAAAVLIAISDFTSDFTSDFASDFASNMPQKVVDDIVARHPDIVSIEVIAAPTANESCRIVASTERKEVGRRCDSDHLVLMKADKVAVDKERHGFDVTVPLHGPSGEVVGIVGITFKTSQTRTTVTQRAQQIAAELEKPLQSDKR